MSDIIKQLMLHEGVRLKPYRCSAGKLTIGVGHNYQDNGLPEWLRSELGAKSNDCVELTRAISEHGFTMEQSDRLLLDDVAKFRMALERRLPWFGELDAIRKRVLIDMAFNMGIATLMTFKNTLKMIEQGDYVGASKGMMSSKWAKQVKGRAERLSKMMATGKDYDAV